VPSISVVKDMFNLQDSFSSNSSIDESVDSLREKAKPNNLVLPMGMGEKNINPLFTPRLSIMLDFDKRSSLANTL
jgi:hypothetical protein